MTDRELMEMAAKAAGYSLSAVSDMIWSDAAVEYIPWNPLTDDGDALRLAVNLSITMDFGGRSETVPANVCANLPKKHRWWATGGISWVAQEYVPEEMWATGRAEDCRFADWYLQTYPDAVKGIGPATRRAIVRAAAEIGKQIKGGQP